MLAEDNLVNQKVALRMLQKLGYQVHTAENGLEALAAINDSPYDLILMDCQMPEMDGLEATRKIRHAERVQCEKTENFSPQALPQALHEKFHIPIIALTANALPGDREACLQAGMDDFLSRPVGLKELSTMITTWLPDPTRSELLEHPVAETEPNPPTTLPSCLDETILQNLKDLGGEDDPEFFLTIIEQFLSDLPRHQEGIKQAIDLQDPLALTKAAYTCKGSSRSIGAMGLGEISYALETMGRDGTLEGASEKFNEWLQEQERTIHALQHEREQLLSSSPSNSFL